MTERLWIDDLRPAPDGWLWAKTSGEAIQILSSDIADEIIEISFDHDLGGDDSTRPVIMWMCWQSFWPPVLRAHTANPVGREWIEGMINRYGPGVTK